MPINFPSSPSVNQTYTYNNQTWVWNGTAWNLNTIPTVTTATNLSGGAANSIPYQTATSTTGMLAAGSEGQVLTVNSSGAPAWQYVAVLQNSESVNYTLVAADASKHILHPSADTSARTFTIPANASVPYPIGTTLTFINQNGAGVVTIAINSDTMRLAGAGTTGSRTLAANGMATAIKITSTEWIINGTGLT